MRNNKNYKVKKVTKLIILKEIRKILVKLKNKIIIFFISELSMMIIFYYFVTAFCEVYRKTQINWLYDFFISFLISVSTEVFGGWILTIFYILSVKYKIKFIYKIVIFFYNF